MQEGQGVGSNHWPGAQHSAQSRAFAPELADTGPHSLLALPSEEHRDSRMGIHHPPSLLEPPTGTSSLPAHKDLGFPLLPTESWGKGEAWLCGYATPPVLQKD